MDTVFDKNEFARLLENAKGDRSINQYALHSRVSATYISKLLREIVEKPPGAVIIKKLADKAQNGITYEKLMRAAGHLAPVHEIKNLSDTLREDSPEYNCNIITLPVVDTVAAGVSILAAGNISRHIDFPKDLAEGATFALRVHGDNMTGVDIHDGDYVVIKQQPTAENGQTVAVFVDDAVTIKRFYKLGDKIRLEPATGGYKPLKPENIKIIGVVMALTRKFF